MGRSWEAPGWALVKYGRKFGWVSQDFLVLGRQNKKCPGHAMCPGLLLCGGRFASGSRTVLSPTACGRSPLAEGAKG